MKKLISAADLRPMAADGKLVLPPQCVLTPSAQDLAKELGIQIIRENPPSRLNNRPGCESTKERSPGDRTDEAGKPATAVETEVRNILAELLKPACPHPKVTQVKGSKVILQPFEQAPPGQKVELKDVITAREANLAAGFMSFDRSRLPWHLTYDEVDYIIEGTFVVETGGKVYTCTAGDVLYIPKDTCVVFSSPVQAKVFYVTYPANWDEL